MPLSSNLRYLLDARGLTQKQAEQAAGLSAGAICHYLSGRSSPRSVNLLRLASALGCSPDDLTGPDLPVHIRKWPPDRETCERKLSEHLAPAIEADAAANTDVIARMIQAETANTESHETQFQPADDVFPAAPLSLYLSDLQALFDACVDDNDPAVIFAQFGKQVYQLMAETRNNN